MGNRVFTREQVESLLSAVKGKTLGEVDKRNLIEIAHKANPGKVQKGIAGDVIELSVLGCDKRDSKQAPDITVDGVMTELKTTGVRKKKKSEEFVAKECITITAVSHDQIVNEEFDNSHFLNKIEHLLFVFYHFLLDESAPNSIVYRDFPILGHLFWQAKPEDLDRLRNDWLLVREFCRNHEFDEREPRKELERNLLLLNYSSPESPRFRFKASFASSIVNDFLGKEQLEALPKPISKFSEIDEKCHLFTERYQGKSISEIAKELGIPINRSQKDISQQIIIRMFGGKAASLNRIRDFSEIGLVAKTIILTSDDKRTEDMKLFQIDFEEWLDPKVTFRDEFRDDEEGLFSTPYSEMYSYFAEQSFIFIVFQEPSKRNNSYSVAGIKEDKIPLDDCRFVGFKRYSFGEDFIMNEAKRTWEESRDRILSGKLENVKSGGGYAPNLPKSKDHILFMRGSGSDGFDKRPVLQKWGYSFDMYIQWVWIKGKYIVEELNKLEYL